MDLQALANVEPATLREVLPHWLAGFIDDPDAAARNRIQITELTRRWSDETCTEILQWLTEIGSEHRVYPAIDACRGLSRTWCRDVVLDPVVHGVEHLAQAVAAGPTMILGNHLSYFDANATDAALAWAGRADLADRLVAAAGPKVYQDLFRLIAAACLNNLPVPQSTTLGHTEKLSPRELARKALAGVNAARQAMLDGYVPLVYPEGSRTRSGQLRPFLRGVHRWLSAVEPLSVVPLALDGTDRIMPVDADRLVPGPVVLRFGQPLAVGPDGTSREVLAAANLALRELLPQRLRPPADLPPTA